MKHNILVCILCAAVANSVFAHGFQKQDVQNLAKAYGYISAQNLVLDQIKNKYPQLITQRGIFIGKWNQRFPAAKEKIVKHLGCFNLTESQVIREMKSYKDYSYIVQQNSVKSLEDAQARLEYFDYRLTHPTANDIEIFKIIDDAVFNDDPVGEYLTNKVEYSTNGHPKSQGLDVRLYIPNSWQRAEGRRPHIVQKWTKVDDGNSIFALVMISDPTGVSLSDLKSSVKTGEVWELLTENVGTLREKGISKFINMGRFPALYISGLVESEQLNTTVYTDMHQIWIPVRGQLVLIQFNYSSGSPEATKQLALKYQAQRQLIASSVYIH